MCTVARNSRPEIATAMTAENIRNIRIMSPPPAGTEHPKDSRQDGMAEGHARSVPAAAGLATEPAFGATNRAMKRRPVPQSGRERVEPHNLVSPPMSRLACEPRRRRDNTRPLNMAQLSEAEIRQQLADCHRM